MANVIEAISSQTVTELPRESSPAEIYPATLVSSPSWVLRLTRAIGRFFGHLLGIVSMLFLLALTASIPIIQFFSFGYLLEVSGRLAREQSFRDAMAGISKARVVGGILLGAWICMMPVKLVSDLWFDAYIIEPSSRQTFFLRIAQLALMAATVGHIAAALICGGKLRYFFWPLVAPFSLGVWAIRRFAGIPLFRRILQGLLGWISPSLPHEICNAKPIGDWFLPAIFWKRIRQGGLYTELRDRVWNFFSGLRPWHYFSLGAKGFLGSFAWLLIPTGLMVISSFSEGGVALISFLLGLLFAIPVFAMLPLVQTHFARDGKLIRFAQPRAAWQNFGRAPISHTMSLLIILLLALPLFLLKIENIPEELLWTLSLVFVLFSWPARLATGWAYRRGVRRERASRWWVRYPLLMLTVPISLTFALIFNSTRFISWHGAFSLFENHVFLLPAPFWL